MLGHQQGIAPDGQPFNIFEIKNQQGMRIAVMDWGATWLSCQVPVKQELREVLLGCKVEDYIRQQAYLGATIGRYANRIANARFSLQGQEYSLTANQDQHQLHGGLVGYDKRRWSLKKSGENFLTFFLHDRAGEQGFIGDVQVFLTYRVNPNNSVEVEFEACANQLTPLNLTNHAYFNLEDGLQGPDVRNHHLQLNANYFLPVDQAGIPNSGLKSVTQTSFDFRQRKRIGQDFLQQEQSLTKGYDHSFLLNEDDEHWAATLLSPSQDLALQIFTSQPALQVYTGNYLQGVPNRLGGKYADYAGIALETQCLPDTPNHPEWQQYGGISPAGKIYYHWTGFQFLVP